MNPISSSATLLAVSFLLLGSFASTVALGQEHRERGARKAKPSNAAPVDSSDEASTFNAGFQTGVNLGTATLANTAVLPAGLQGNSTTSTPTTHAGFMLGGNVEYGFSKQFFLQFEGSYVNKSVGISTTTANAQGVTQGTSTETDNLNYLEFVLLAKYKFTGGKLVPNLFLGPNLGFLLSANQTFTPVSTGVVGTTNTTNTTTSNFNSTDFAFDLGGGLEYPVFEFADLFFSVRYSLGLSNVQAVPATSSWKTRGIQILVGLEFGLF